MKRSVAAFAAVLAAACGEESAEPVAQTEAPDAGRVAALAEYDVPNNPSALLGDPGNTPWPSCIVGVQKERVENVNIEDVPEAELPTHPTISRDAPPADIADPSLVSHAFNREDGSVAIVDYDAACLGSMEAPELTSGDPVMDVQKSWSNGVDNRTKLATSLSTRTPWAQQGPVEDFCSSTFLRVWGPSNNRYAWVLTAAHCIYDTAGNHINATIRPGVQNGTPWGEWRATGATWVPNSWFSSCRTGSRGSWTCLQDDIALVKVRQVSGSGHPGWLAFNNRHGSKMNSDFVYFSGFPQCNNGNDPQSNCVEDALYTDRDCAFDNFQNRDTDNWNRNIDHSCDNSADMSGGPMVSKTTGPWTVYAVGVAEYTGDTSASPNIVRRITPNTKNTLSWLVSNT